MNNQVNGASGIIINKKNICCNLYALPPIITLNLQGQLAAVEVSIGGLNSILKSPFLETGL